MSLDFVAEVWDVLISHIDFNDRADAADTLVNLLIDNDYEASDIKEAFRKDKEVITALKEYTDQIEEEYEEYDDDTESDEDEW
jgi:hypothetical protein